MRISALKGLIYRNFFLGRKNMLVHGVLSLFIMVFGILVSLSTKYGNLALVPDSHRDLLEDYLFMFSWILPAYMCASAVITVTETVQSECDRKWRRFRLSTPVSGYLFTLASYMVQLVTVAIYMGISFVYIWGNSAITGEPISPQNIAFMLTVTIILLMFSLLYQILIHLLDSVDKAAIVLFVIVLSLMLCLMMTHTEEWAGAGWDFLLDLSATYLPHITLVFVIFLIVSYVVTAALYERREK